MIAYLSLDQIQRIHQRQLEEFGGATGLRDQGALEAAVARPRATFGGEDLYPTLVAKAAALLHSLVSNHPFVDGNKRTGIMAAELFILANGYEVMASDDDLEALTLGVATSEYDAEAIAIWFEQRLRQML